MKSAMTSSPLRVAIIGAGQVADKVHASYYCTRNDLELVAVCDSRLSQAQALAEKYGNASVWDDPQAMLLAVKPDVVSVCSPNRFHYEHTLMALEAGCHVMCEKPPAMTPEQALEMCDTARKLGKVLAYDFHHRFALDTQQLRDQVTNGVLGEIYVTTARALRRCGVPGWGVFTNKELQGGGPLIDIGIHMLDAAMYVLHLVADIAWAVIQYWQTTGDESFIAHEGMALLLETAKFWISRAVRVNDRLEIHDVIGPDEYTEHVNNNAFTSYMAYYNVQQALSIARQFGCSDDAFIHRAEMFLKELRLPEIQPDGVLPQDDSFMAKPAINLAKYKAAAGKQTILLDYSRAEVNEMQILKQADVVMLNYMLPEQFSAASCLANLQFYEPRTIHDSSLSKAIHGIVAARCGLLTQSYQFWREGTEIDLGADPHSCDDGIHAAATGAIWLGAIQGFAGVSVRDGELHLNPALPEQWQQLSFPLFWQGCELQVTLDAQRIAIRTSAPVSLRLNGQLISVAEESVFCLGDFILPFNGTATTHQEDE